MHLIHVMCHMSCVTCHVSHVAWHMSRVKCHMSCVWLFFFFFFGHSGEVFWWRECYQRGLPLVMKDPNKLVVLLLPQDLQEIANTNFKKNRFYSILLKKNHLPIPCLYYPISGQCFSFKKKHRETKTYHSLLIFTCLTKIFLCDRHCFLTLDIFGAIKCAYKKLGQCFFCMWVYLFG